MKINNNGLIKKIMIFWKMLIGSLKLLMMIILPMLIENNKQ